MLARDDHVTCRPLLLSAVDHIDHGGILAIQTTLCRRVHKTTTRDEALEAAFEQSVWRHSGYGRF